MMKRVLAAILSIVVFTGVVLVALGAKEDAKIRDQRAKHKYCEGEDRFMFSRCLRTYDPVPIVNEFDETRKNIYLGLGVPFIIIPFFCLLICLSFDERVVVGLGLQKPAVAKPGPKKVLMTQEEWNIVGFDLRRAFVWYKMNGVREVAFDYENDNREELEEVALKTNLVEKVEFDGKKATFFLL